MVKVLYYLSKLGLGIVEISKALRFLHFSIIDVEGFEHPLVFYVKFPYMSDSFLEMMNILPAMKSPEELLDYLGLI